MSLPAPAPAFGSAPPPQVSIPRTKLFPVSFGFHLRHLDDSEEPPAFTANGIGHGYWSAITHYLTAKAEPDGIVQVGLVLRLVLLPRLRTPSEAEFPGGESWGSQVERRDRPDHGDRE